MLEPPELVQKHPSHLAIDVVGAGRTLGRMRRTFSNCLLTEIARYIDFFHTSSAWFDCTTPSPTTSLQGLQGHEVGCGSMG